MEMTIASLTVILTIIHPKGKKTIPSIFLPYQNDSDSESDQEISQKKLIQNVHLCTCVQHPQVTEDITHFFFFSNIYFILF